MGGLISDFEAVRPQASVRTDQIYAGNVEDRATMAAKLKERKIANTKASVVLGEDEPVWETDMMRSMSNGEITPEFIQCMIEDKQQADS